MRVCVCGGSNSHRHHLALRGHKRRPVADAEFSLQGVEADLQLTLLLYFGRFVHPAVISEILQLPLHLYHGLLRRTILQPGNSSSDPLQQLESRGIFRRREKCVSVCRVCVECTVSDMSPDLTSQSFIVLHQLLIFLIHSQDLTDPVSSSFSLRERITVRMEGEMDVKMILSFFHSSTRKSQYLFSSSKCMVKAGHICHNSSLIRFRGVQDICR